MKNRVALITGAARGIGRGIAEALAAKGFSTAINDICEEERAEAALQACKKTGAPDAIYCRADISDADQRKSMVDTVKKNLGRLDVLVNNAGVAPNVRADLLEATEESFDRVLKINLKGPYFLSQLVAGYMIEQLKEDPHRRPVIINTASISSYASSPARGEYCISKAGVSMMTKLYADRLAEYGINVYEVRPGIIMTDMTSVVKEKYDKLISEGLTPIKRWGYPEDIGRAVVMLAEGALPFSTGEVINVDGGFHLRRL
ncbi:MAG: 3-ketoacyl-ACP reductase [Chitinivibrionales bacterium]|nr:3-ketoacyl-ACP reductase [Chitinivibrionales bacterium]MBD3356170.1 3-ketoacyl-ACP reductase [Chitinivibrionales bacterium]